MKEHEEYGCPGMRCDEPIPQTRSAFEEVAKRRASSFVNPNAVATPDVNPRSGSGEAEREALVSAACAALAKEEVAIFKEAARAMHRRAQANEGAAKRLAELRTSMQREIDRLTGANRWLFKKLKEERSRASKLEAELLAVHRKLARDEPSFLSRVFGPSK